MKKFIAKVLLLLAHVGVFLALLCVAVDPFNVFHPLNARNTGATPNLRYIKTVYLLDNPKKYDSFIFGSSRVSAIYAERMHHDSEQYYFYNMTVPEGLPADCLETIQLMLQNEMKIKKIYVGLDTPYRINPDERVNELLKIPYGYFQTHKVRVWSQYMDPARIHVYLRDYWHVMGLSEYGKAERIYTNGNYWSWEGAGSFGNGAPGIRGAYYRIDETLAEIEQIVMLCKENDIEYVFFTIPPYRWGAYVADGEHHRAFLQGLVAITPFYNFCGANEITRDGQYWADDNHFTIEAGNMMVDVMCNGERFDELYEQGFGWYVTEDNIDALLALPELNV